MEEVRKIFEETLEQNKCCREAMLSLIASHEAIAFVGAGLSAHPCLSYPTWEELLEKLRVAANMIEEFTFSAEATGNALLMAEEILLHFASRKKIDEFKSILSREYGPRPGKNCSPTHDLLVRLPFKAFAVTNYDDCIESALNDWHASRKERTRPSIGTHIKLNRDARHMVSRFVRSLSNAFDISNRYVMHLHGWHNDPESIILAASQYYNAYGFETKNGRITKEEPRSTIHRQLVWALFATRKLVFFGCSMDDPYIIELLRIVASDLWEMGQAIHFVVLPLDAQSVDSADTQIEWFRQFGLEVVFFDNWDGTFSKLDQLLDLAASHCSSDNTTQVNPNLNDQIQKAPKTDIPAIDEVKTDLAWLEEVNERTAKDLTKNEN